MECPICGHECYWMTVGYDSLGAIKEATCQQCAWCESDGLSHEDLMKLADDCTPPPELFGKD